MKIKNMVERLVDLDADDLQILLDYAIANSVYTNGSTTRSGLIHAGYDTIIGRFLIRSPFRQVVVSYDWLNGYGGFKGQKGGCLLTIGMCLYHGKPEFFIFQYGHIATHLVPGSFIFLNSVIGSTHFYEGPEGADWTHLHFSILRLKVLLSSSEYIMTCEDLFNPDNRIRRCEFLKQKVYALGNLGHVIPSIWHKYYNINLEFLDFVDDSKSKY